MIEFVGLREKTYAYLMDDDSEHHHPLRSQENKEVRNKTRAYG